MTNGNICDLSAEASLPGAAFVCASVRTTKTKKTKTAR